MRTYPMHTTTSLLHDVCSFSFIDHEPNETIHYYTILVHSAMGVYLSLIRITFYFTKQLIKQYPIKIKSNGTTTIRLMDPHYF